MTEEQKQSSKAEFKSVKDFFEKIPPGKMVAVKQLAQKVLSQYGYSYRISLPFLELHCGSPTCKGNMLFEATESISAYKDKRSLQYITFKCRNCGKSEKTYAFSSYLNSDETSGELFKFGEAPPFGPPTPARVISLLGAERDYYLKGRRAENQGLGIAAFAYYRRVVENQKNKILDEIMRVSEKIGAPKEILDDLNLAKQETQFSKAVEAIKHGIPQALLVNGHNPLTLLYSALSEGIHAQTDDQCLELATSIRVILTDLIDRLVNALKDEAELNAAVSRLLKASAPKTDDTTKTNQKE